MDWSLYWTVLLQLFIGIVVLGLPITFLIRLVYVGRARIIVQWASKFLSAGSKILQDATKADERRVL